MVCVGCARGLLSRLCFPEASSREDAGSGAVGTSGHVEQRTRGEGLVCGTRDSCLWTDSWAGVVLQVEGVPCAACEGRVIRSPLSPCVPCLVVCGILEKQSRWHLHPHSAARPLVFY